MATRGQDLAAAYEKLARANHYMIGITVGVTPEEREEARAILIDNENRCRSLIVSGKVMKLALDLFEHDEQQNLLLSHTGSEIFRPINDHDGSSAHTAAVNAWQTKKTSHATSVVFDHADWTKRHIAPMPGPWSFPPGEK